jgi:aconitase B|tara:strand:- start:9675 stop:9854 length:180 start_codon:yes stop_codon:yes gene_type:complete
MKATGDLATMIGWSSERFARLQKVKSLDEYLKPAKPTSADEGARAVQRMFARMAAKQGE